MTSLADDQVHVDALEPIARIDLTEEVVRRFKLLLEQGNIRPGGRLAPERELATLLGISRPSLRHGLKALELMGAIVSRRRHGTFVSTSARHVLDNPLDFIVLLSDIPFDEVFEVRQVVEVELAALAAKRASPSDLAAIESSLDQQKAHFHSPEEFLTHDLEFHSLIAKAAQNILFTLFLDSIRRLVSRNMHMSLRLRTEEDFSRTYQEHCEIFRNLRRGDELGSRRAMISHLDRVYAQWRQGHATTASRTRPSRKSTS